MKILTAYVGTVDGFRKWLKGQRPSKVISLMKYKRLKEKRRQRGRRS